MSKSQEISLTARTVPEAFSFVAKRFSDHVAVACGDESLSYGELELRSDALAALLREKGVRAGDLVGVCTERRVELPVALLAILKAGAGYVPLDSAYPDSRLIEIAEDANFQVLLGEHPALQTRFESLEFDNFPAEGNEPDATAELEAGSESVAYVMFTSGSTGKPKGVAVPHRAILRLVHGQDFCELGPEERILQHSPVAFDASTFEIWGALLNGGQLVVFDEEELTLRGLGNALLQHEITTVWLTAGLFHAMVDDRCDDLAGLKQLLTGGDVVSPLHAESLLNRFPDINLINGYGPTENTTFTCCHRITLDDVSGGKAIPIGKPIQGSSVHILGEDLNPVEPGQAGELCAGGDGVAIGYWNRPDLTESRFVSPEWDRSLRLYRTGDLVAQGPDGTCEFLGRMDQQVKIRGYRIEMGEIETALLDLEGIQQAVVVARKRGEGSDKVIVAYYVGDTEIDHEVTREQLKETLPHYAVPNFFQRISEIPLSPNGKIDRKALPELDRIEDEDSCGSGVTDFRSTIRELFSEVLDMPEIPTLTNFFDLGISSLQIARVHEKVQSRLGIEFPITDFFQYSTIAAISDFIEKKQLIHPVRNRGSRRIQGEEHIAIVGMAGRFPGAPDVDTFWQNLIEGRETITHFSADELEFENATAAGADPEDLYVRSRGIVEGSDLFDARHFGISPREAEELDPQHRLLLECAQTALENSGHDPDRYEGKIGLFCGASQNSYLLNNLCGNPEISRRLAAGYPTSNLNVILGNDKDFLPTRIAYKLNLRGPAVSVQCACSTSLVSVAQACESIQAGQCDVAIAGGISLGHPQKRDYLYTPDGIASKDGHCRTFDEKATGTVFGEGVGLVVLKPLSAALEDGDQVVAVIRGFAVNNDGGNKAGFAAPGIEGQSEVIRQAQSAAGVEARSIGYVEAHGTATPLGDPIEIAALTRAFREETEDRQFCRIGSVKTNVGHLDIAAGVTGLIKAALTVRNGMIPPLLHFDRPNPNIDFESSPFQPVDRLTEWKEGDSPRRAGVSAFGVGGTNVHMILEEPPAKDSPELENVEGEGKPLLVFPFSASDPEALRESIGNFAGFIEENPETSLSAMANTLQKGRREFGCRAVLVADTARDLADQASSYERRPIESGSPESVMFMFPGQGAQHPGMGQDLYSNEPVFRGAFDHCANLIEMVIDEDIRSIVFPDPKHREEKAGILKNTNLAQPAIFSIEYALTQLWRHWGIEPAAMIGHSIGEFAAACIAGVFSLEDAIRMICIRGQLMAISPVDE